MRNRANRPDKWEANVIETMFKDPGYEKNKVHTENAQHKGKDAFRLILPDITSKPAWIATVNLRAQLILPEVKKKVQNWAN